MLGQPEAGVSPRLGVLGEVECVGKGLRRRPAFNDGREVENRERDHHAATRGLVPGFTTGKARLDNRSMNSVT